MSVKKNTKTSMLTSDEYDRGETLLSIISVSLCEKDLRMNSPRESDFYTR